MKKNSFRGMGRVLAFTIARETKGKGYRGLTIAVALICLLAPVLWLGLSSGGEKTPETGSRVEQIVYVNETEGEGLPLERCPQLLPEVFAGIVCRQAESVQAAEAMADRKTLVVALREGTDGVSARVLLPEDTELTEADARSCADGLEVCLPRLILDRAGVAPEQLPRVESRTEQKEAESGGARGIVTMAVSYVTLMALYFMVLFYGQSTANSVLLEKSSKLMEFFLVTVNPVAMVLGKILAIALAGLIQVALWCASLAAGIGVGCAIGRLRQADGMPEAVQLVKSLISSGMFSAGGAVLAVCIVVAGFLMYCALSAIGGALAGKAEDLGMTNQLFSLALVVSFLACLLGGGMEGSVAPWLCWVPFTAVLVVPGQVLLGSASLWQGAACLLETLAFAVALGYFAGYIYRMMALYKGNPPSPGRLIQMARLSKYG